MPNDVKLTIWLAVAAFIVLLIDQAKRVIVARIDKLLAHMSDEQSAQKARDIRSDEIQANVRKLTNGNGVHHADIPKAEPQFNGQPPVVVVHDRRSQERPVDGSLPTAGDIAAHNQKYIDIRGPLDPRD
jgi:hypothetical protein